MRTTATIETVAYFCHRMLLALASLLSMLAHREVSRPEMS